MDRKFVIALSSLAGSMLLTEAHAIGLGEITLKTSLNEPLQAEIQLVQLNDLAENEILVNLAPPAEFDKAGVERDFLLNSLRFKLDLSDPKKPRVVVTTQQPMREPYLNFLIEVQWPSGRLLREYTLLMDLPAFNDVESAATAGVQQTSVPVSRTMPPEMEDAPEEPVSSAETVAVEPEEAVKAPETTPPEVAAEQQEPAPVEEPQLAEPEVAEAPRSAPAETVVRRATPDEIRNYRSASVPAPVSEPAAETPVEQEIATQEAAEPVVQEPVAEEPAAQEPVAETPATEEAPAEEQAAEAEQPEPAAEPEPVQAESSVPSAVEYGPTDSNDTLWRIAQQVQSSGTIHQNMVAIQRLNPEAFIGSNINLLKKGKVLRLPTPEEIDSLLNKEAIAEVNSQTAAWQAQRSAAKTVAGAQMDATGRVAATEKPAAANDGQLKLATPGDSSTQAVQGAGEKPVDAEKVALENELSVSLEELNRVQRENKESSSRVQDLDAQITNAERLLELQSGELASMQAKLAEEQQAKLAADAQAKLDADAKAAADAQAKLDADAKAAAEAQAKLDVDAKAAADAQAKLDADAKAAAEAQAKLDADAKAADDQSTDEQAAAVEPQEAVVTEAKPEPTAIAAPTDLKEVAKPVVVEEKPAQPVDAAATNGGFSQQIIGSVVFIGLLLLGLFGYRRISAKRAAAQDELNDIDQDDVSSVMAAQADHDLDELDEEIDAASHDGDAEVESPQTSTAAQVTDVLGEADIYISFGNFEKAEAILKTAIQSEPVRTDYRLKLLELYKESDNLAAFDAAYKDLIELDDDAVTADAGVMRGKLSAAASTPFAFGVAAVAEAAGIPDDFDLDFDDLETTEAVKTVEAVPAQEADEFDLGFDLDLDVAAPPVAAAEELLDLDSLFEAETPADDSFDLDLSFDMDETAPAVATVEDAFDLDMAFDEPVAVAAGPDASTEAFDLDLAFDEPAVVAAESDASTEAFDLDLAFDEPAVEVAVSPQAEVSADDLGLDFDLDFAEPAPASEEDVDRTVRRESFATAGLPAAAPETPHVDSSLLEAVAPDVGDMDEDLDFLTDADESATKLDLARAYIDMGDKEGARDILEEVLEEGGPDQKAEAQQLLRTIGG